MQKLLWLDMEMTGLEVEKERVIEVAAIVTDMNFNELESFETVVKQDKKFLDAMDEWNREHHHKSGLAAKVANGMDPIDVEDRLIEICEKHFPNHHLNKSHRPILAGNSIMQDRLFIDAYFPELSHRLHYRMLDVSSWKIIFGLKYNLFYQKQNQHRALDDIRESMSELKYYLSFLNITSPTSL